jgi:hypothetical protein
MSKNILLVFEGAKTEPGIFDNIKKVFFTKNGESMIYAIFGTNIYNLWLEIKDDPYINTLAILQGRAENKAILAHYSRKDFAEIHLFFDYEGHAHKGMTLEDYNAMIFQMLATFDDEYNDHGRLWISYPMVEALKHCKWDLTACFDECCAEITDYSHYKERIGQINDFQDVRLLTWPAWRYLIAINIQKAFCLVDGHYRMPTYREVVKLFDQMVIFKKQEEKFIIPADSVAVLSAFPFFLSDRFKEPQYQEILAQGYIKPCGFHCICS